MHKDIKKLNKQDPPPKGYNHKAYEAYRIPHSDDFVVGYLDDGHWHMPIRRFKTEAQALRFILDKLYFGEDN